jgi:propanol-preferring alcohol dehydrogenase
VSTILIATDGSPAAEAAVTTGVRFAAEHALNVVFVHAYREIDVFAVAFTGVVAVPHAAVARDADTPLAAAAEVAHCAGVAHDERLGAGATVDAILRTADEVEVIVSGSNRHGRWQPHCSAASRSSSSGERAGPSSSSIPPLRRHSPPSQRGAAMSSTLERTVPIAAAPTGTMRAAVVHSFREPLRLEHVPKPIAGEGEVVVRIEASGLCHTDIHAAHGDWPVKPSPPFIPGHEGVGIVESIGSHVNQLQVGERVAVPWLGYACGTCDHCVSGWETLCLSQRNTGYSVDGGFAEYVKASAAYVVRVPEGVDPVDAAPLTCAGVTTYKAVKVSGARSSDLVAVFGIGGLGHLAVQYARIAGARVVAVDVRDEKLELARELGADFTVNAAKEDAAEAIQRLGGADAAIALAVVPKAFSDAYGSLRRGGTLVFVRLPADNKVELPIFETVLNGITVVGSIVGTRTDLREVFELHAAGRTRVIREERPLGNVNEAIAEVDRGDVPARIVFRP